MDSFLLSSINRRENEIVRNKIQKKEEINEINGKHMLKIPILEGSKYI